MVKVVVAYCASGFKERRRLIADFNTMKLELGEHPRNFLLRVDQIVQELESVERPVDPKDVKIGNLNNLLPPQAKRGLPFERELSVQLSTNARAFNPTNPHRAVRRCLREAGAATSRTNRSYSLRVRGVHRH